MTSHVPRPRSAEEVARLDDLTEAAWRASSPVERAKEALGTDEVSEADLAMLISLGEA